MLHTFRYKKSELFCLCTQPTGPQRWIGHRTRCPTPGPLNGDWQRLVQWRLRVVTVVDADRFVPYTYIRAGGEGYLPYPPPPPRFVRTGPRCQLLLPG